MGKWEMVRLGDVCEFINGDRGVNYPSKSDFVNIGIPFINAGHLKNKQVSFDEMNYICEDKYNKIGSGKTQYGDLIYCLRGSLGKQAIVRNIEKAAIASSLVILRPTKKITVQYLSHLLNSELIKKQQEQNNTGSSQPNLSASNVKKYNIPLPPLEEQKKIAKNLDLASELVALYKTKLEELDKLIQSVFYTMFGDPVTNEKGWEVKKIHQVYNIIDGDRGSNYPNQADFSTEGHCLFLNTGNVTKNGFSFEKTSFITKEKDEKLRKGKLQKNDIILTTRGTVGNLAYFTSEIPFDNVRINSGMVILRRLSEINNIYFIHYFSNPLIYKRLMSGSAQPQLPITSMKKANVIAPPLPLQQKFANIVIQIEQQKTEVNKTLQNAEMLYNSLMQKYFE